MLCFWHLQTIPKVQANSWYYGIPSFHGWTCHLRDSSTWSDSASGKMKTWSSEDLMTQKWLWCGLATGYYKPLASWTLLLDSSICFVCDFYCNVWLLKLEVLNVNLKGSLRHFQGVCVRYKKSEAKISFKHTTLLFYATYTQESALTVQANWCQIKVNRLNEGLDLVLFPGHRDSRLMMHLTLPSHSLWFVSYNLWSQINKYFKTSQFQVLMQ